MKNIIFTIIIFFVMQTVYACSVSFTTSVSGAVVTVTPAYTPPVYSGSMIVTSTFTYGDMSTPTDYTSHTYNAAGTYTIKFLMTWIDTITHAFICSDSVSHTVTTTVNGPSQITGTVGMDTVSGVWVQKIYQIWLITYDTATQNLAAVDSFTTPSTGYTFEHYTFNNVHAGQYRVKAMQTNGVVGGTGAIPTYGYDSLYWNGAQIINYNGLGVSSGNNIFMQQGTVTSGPGFISGNVTSGANKGTKVTGMPAANIEILLETMTGTPLAYMLTDANGNYQFSNIPVGTYMVYPEILGYNTSPAVVTVGTAQVTNVNFVQHTISKSATPTNVAILPVATNSLFNISPNPGSGLFNISWSSNTPINNAHASISDVAGRKVYETDLSMNAASGNTQLNLSQLRSGMYFININAGNVNYTGKVVLQH